MHEEMLFLKYLHFHLNPHLKDVPRYFDIILDVLPPHARDFSRELGGFLLEF